MKNYNTRKKYYAIVAAVLIQLCVGIGNLWSIFQEGIAKTIFLGDNAGASLSFSLLLAMLGVGGIIGGKIEEKYSIRTTIIVGSLLIFIGFFATGFVTSATPWLIWITYGIIGGLGSGICYSPSISCAQKWFPKKRGLVTGIVVAALGASGIIFTPVMELLIDSFGGVGAGEQNTFIVLSIISLIVCMGSGFVMTTPKEGEVEQIKLSATKDIKNYSSKEMVKKPEFYIIILTFFLGCMGGLMILGFAKPIAVAKGLGEAAAIGVLLIAIFNALGRLFWGMVSDRIGRINTITIILVGSAIFSFLVPLAEGYMIFAVIAGVGFFYGGLLTSFPALTADTFGPKYMATNYGIVLTSFGISAIVSSQIAGYYKNIAVTDIDLMAPAFYIATASAGIAIGLITVLRVKRKKESVEARSK